MHHVEQAIELLRDASGLKRLMLDADGSVSLKIGQDISLFIVKSDAHSLELVSKLPEIEADPSVHVLRMLLSSNAKGTQLGRARFAIGGEEGTVFLTEQVDVRPLSFEAFARTIAAFVRNVRFWRSAEGLALIATPPAAPAADVLSEIFGDDEIQLDSDAMSSTPVLIKI